MRWEISQRKKPKFQHEKHREFQMSTRAGVFSSAENMCCVTAQGGAPKSYLGTILHARQLAILFPLLTVLHGNRSCVSPVFIISATSPPSSFPIGNESCPQQSKSQSTGEGAELSELSLSGQNVEETVRIQEETQDFSRSFAPTGK